MQTGGLAARPVTGTGRRRELIDDDEDALTLFQRMTNEPLDAPTIRLRHVRDVAGDDGTHGREYSAGETARNETRPFLWPVLVPQPSLDCCWRRGEPLGPLLRAVIDNLSVFRDDISARSTDHRWCVWLP